MDTLPIVTLILWSTGLSILALFGLVLNDWRAERRHNRSAFTKSRLVESSPMAARPRPTKLEAIVEANTIPLAKAA